MATKKPWERERTELTTEPISNLIRPSNLDATPAPSHTNTENPFPTSTLQNTNNTSSPFLSSNTNTYGNSYNRLGGDSYNSYNSLSNRYGSGFGSNYNTYGGVSSYGSYGSYPSAFSQFNSSFSPYSSSYSPYSQNQNQIGGPFFFLERLNSYVFGLCDIARIVEANAGGLAQFCKILLFCVKRIGAAGKAGFTSVLRFVLEKVRWIVGAVREVVRMYFYDKELGLEQLEKQVKALKRIKAVLFISLFLIFIKIFIYQIKHTLA